MKLKRTLTSIVALLLACIMPISAIAATYEVGTGAELAEKFNATTEDATVDITITADITDAIGELTSQNGKTYTINANSDGDGKKYEIKQGVEISGAGTVNINTNIDTSGLNDIDGLYVEGGADVTVDGNVISGNSGVIAWAEDDGDPSSPTVTVTGSIVAEGNGVTAGGSSKVTVGGNVTSEGDNRGVYTQDTAEVEVGGNVEAYRSDDGIAAGVRAGDSSKVTVGNGVVGGDHAIYASDSAEVIVKAGGVTGLDAEGPDEYDFGTSGITAKNNAVVKVNGDVKGGNGNVEGGYGGDAVTARGTSYVEINGSAIGGSAASHGGDGVEMKSTATVRISGDVKGGNATGNATAQSKPVAGYGAVIEQVYQENADQEDTQYEVVSSYSSELTVLGSIIGGTATGTGGYDGAGVLYRLNSVEDIEPTYITDEKIAQMVELMSALELTEEKISTYQNDVTNGTYQSAETGALNAKSYAVYKAVYDMLEIQSQITDAFCKQNPFVSIGDAGDLKSALEKKLAESVKVDSFDSTDITTANCDWSKLNDTDTDTLKTLIAEMADIYNEYFQEFTNQLTQNAKSGNKKLPTLTTWKIASGANNTINPVVAKLMNVDAGLITDGEVITNLNSLHNFIVHLASTQNGSISVDKATAKPGETVTITATPDSGYKLASLNVTGAALSNQNGVYSFVMSEYGGVTVSATFESAASATAAGPATDDGSSLVLYSAISALSAMAFVTLALNKKRRAK